MYKFLIYYATTKLATEKRYIRDFCGQIVASENGYTTWRENVWIWNTNFNISPEANPGCGFPKTPYYKIHEYTGSVNAPKSSII